MASRRLDLRGLLESQRVDRLVLEDVLLDFAGDRTRQVVHDHHVLRNLEISDLITAIAFQVVGLERGAVLEHDPGGDGLAVLGIGKPRDGHFGDGGMVMQELFDLGRIDVLAAADDQLLASADDAEVAVVAAPGQVAGVQPAGGVDGVRVAAGLL